MSEHLYEGHFAIHGVNITVRSDNPAIVEMTHSRIGHFAAGNEHAVDGPKATFVFSTRSNNGDPPNGCREAGRNVYNIPDCDVNYFEESDSLEIRHRIRHLHVWADLERFRVDFSLDESPSSMWLGTHSLFTVPLLEVLKRCGLFSIHAAGVSLERVGFVFPGASGSGKSTIALALISAGYDFLSDDTLFLSRAEERLRICAFPDEMDLTDDCVARFPDVSSWLSTSPVGSSAKRQLAFTPGLFGVQVEEMVEPRLVIFPRIAKYERCGFHLLDKAVALAWLEEAATTTSRRLEERHRAQLRRLIVSCRTYLLDLGRDIKTLPERLAELY